MNDALNINKKLKIFTYKPTLIAWISTVDGSSLSSLLDSSSWPTEVGGTHKEWFWWWREEICWGGDVRWGGGDDKGRGEVDDKWEWWSDEAELEWCGGDVSGWSIDRDEWCDERWCNEGGGVGDVMCGEGGEVAWRVWGKGGVRVGGRGGVGVGVATPPDDWANCFAPSKVIGSANVALSSSSSLKIISCRKQKVINKLKY